MLSLLGRLMDASNVTTAMDGAGALQALLTRVAEGNTKVRSFFFVSFPLF